MTEQYLNEKEMRDMEKPWPKTMDELIACIDTLVERPHDYGTAVYAMSLAATAAFNYVSGRLGVTGWQASCADLDFLRRSRRLECPFAIVKGSDLLYPQYDLFDQVDRLIDEWLPWASKEAKKLLEENSAEYVAPNVREHWMLLASAAATSSSQQSTE